MATAETKEIEKHLNPMSEEDLTKFLDEMQEDYNKAVKNSRLEVPTVDEEIDIIKKFIDKYSIVNKYEFSDEKLQKQIRAAQVAILYAKQEIAVITKDENTPHIIPSRAFDNFIEHGIPIPDKDEADPDQSIFKEAFKLLNLKDAQILALSLLANPAILYLPKAHADILYPPKTQESKSTGNFREGTEHESNDNTEEESKESKSSESESEHESNHESTHDKKTSTYTPSLGSENDNEKDTHTPSF